MGSSLYASSLYEFLLVPALPCHRMLGGFIPVNTEIHLYALNNYFVQWCPCTAAVNSYLFSSTPSHSADPVKQHPFHLLFSSTPSAHKPSNHNHSTPSCHHPLQQQQLQKLSMRLRLGYNLSQPFAVPLQPLRPVNTGFDGGVNGRTANCFVVWGDFDPLK